jgi:hypothetical protein
MFGKYNPRDWALTPELQQRLEKVQAETRRLQAQFGITPKTLEERHQDYLVRKAEKERQQKELELLAELKQKQRPALPIRK